jgi:hypothetical protein
MFNLSNRKFAIFIVASTLCISVFVGMANFVIDPYGKNNIFKNGLNEFKIVRDERISKYELLNDNPDASSFIFGSSRGLILDPEVVEHVTSEKTLNLAFSSATAEEYHLYIKYLFETRDVKNIIIGIDLFAYAAGFESTGTFPQALRDYFEMDKEYDIAQYLSFRMFKRTIKAVRYNLAHDVPDIDDRYTGKGKIILSDYVDALKDKDDFEYYISRHVVSRPSRWATRYDGLDMDRLTALSRIKQLCVQNGANLYIFTSPLFIKQITMKQNKFYLQEDLLRYIVRNVGPVLDMNTIRQTNTEPAFYIDEFHYSYEFADSIITQLITGKPSDEKYRGELVTKENLDNYITQVEDRIKKISASR